jgi:hypothetical protein
MITVTQKQNGKSSMNGQTTPGGGQVQTGYPLCSEIKRRSQCHVAGRLRAGLAMAALLSLLVGSSASAGSIAWKQSRDQAVETARNSGKLILLVAGRETCESCRLVKETVCEAPSVRQILNSNYVCWFCSVDASQEWKSYLDGMGSAALPVMCVIDPGDPSAYLDRSMGLQTITTLSNRLTSHIPTRVSTVTLVRAGSRCLRWNTQARVVYRVLRSEDLTHWDFVSSPLVGTGQTTDFVVPLTASRSFYKVMGFK